MIKIKTKKWIIVLSVLVALAIAVTLIVVLVPKDYSKIKTLTQNHEETMYLNSEKDEDYYDYFKDKISVIYPDDYGPETEYVNAVMEGLQKVGTFYSEYIIFAQSNKQFKNQYRTLVNAYKDIDKIEADLRQLVIDADAKPGNQESTFLDSAWKDFKKIFIRYISKYATIASSLKVIFKSCITDGVLQNSMTFLVLDCVDAYLHSLSLGFENMSKKAEFFNKFTDYLTLDNRSTLAKYNYDSALRQKIKLVEDFSSVYNKKIADLIDSMDAKGFTLESSQSDTSGILSQTKSFLQGGVK